MSKQTSAVRSRVLREDRPSPSHLSSAFALFLAGVGYLAAGLPVPRHPVVQVAVVLLILGGGAALVAADIRRTWPRVRKRTSDAQLRVIAGRKTPALTSALSSENEVQHGNSGRGSATGRGLPIGAVLSGAAVSGDHR